MCKEGHTAVPHNPNPNPNPSPDPNPNPNPNPQANTSNLGDEKQNEIERLEMEMAGPRKQGIPRASRFYNPNPSPNPKPNRTPPTHTKALDTGGLVLIWNLTLILLHLLMRMKMAIGR